MEKAYVKVWESCLGIIKDNVSSQSFKTWFEPIKPIKLNSSVLTIQVPSQFFYEWLEEHYITLLKKTIKKELGFKLFKMASSFGLCRFCFRVGYLDSLSSGEQRFKTR